MEVPPPPSIVQNTSELHTLPMFNTAASFDARSFLTPMIILSNADDGILIDYKPVSTQTKVEVEVEVEQKVDVKALSRPVVMVKAKSPSRVREEDTEGHTSCDDTPSPTPSPVSVSVSDGENSNHNGSSRGSGSGSISYPVCPQTPDFTPHRPIKSKSSSRRRPVCADDRATVRWTAEKRRSYQFYHQYYQNQMMLQEEKKSGRDAEVTAEEGQDVLVSDEDFDSFLFTLVDDIEE